MDLFVASVIILLLIMGNPYCGISLPLPKTDPFNYGGLSQFLTDEKKNVYYKNTTTPTTEIAIKRDSFHGIFLDRNIESDDNTSTPLRHRSRERQTQMMEQFGQKQLPNNPYDASYSDNILWQQFRRRNFRPQLSTSPSHPPITSHPNTLLSQETTQLDPIYHLNKPPVKVTAITPSSSDNVLIDLLHNQHNQPSITGSNTNGLEFPPKISRTYFNSYLTGLINSVRGITTAGDCSLLVKMLPGLLMNEFIHAVTSIINLQLANSLMIPFVVLSVVNFVTAFLFLDEYCPGSN